MKSALEFRRLIVFVLLMAEVAFCQTLQFKNFSEKDGIPGNMVSCFMQDSKGYLWIGTENGLSRYDGIEFKIYRKEDGLPDNGILSILEDREGRIWIGTNRGGLGCYHFGKFIKYSK
ncbi:MAG: hypothetical protein GY765_24175, partial [bacterium]|nr:hypothetical protein [bacterium]